MARQGVVILGATGGPTPLPPGAEGTFLMSDNGASVGLSWQTPQGSGQGMANPGGANATVVGSVLTVSSTAGTLAWQSPASAGVPPTRQVIAGTGMTGGGPLSADVTLNAAVTSVFGRTGAVVLAAADISGASGVISTRQVNTGTGLTGGGALSANLSLSVVPNSTQQLIAVSKDGAAAVGPRQQINFITGSNMTLTVADNAGNNRVDVTITGPAPGGGGMTDPLTTLGDLIVRGSGGTTRLPRSSTNGQVLTVDTGNAAYGLSWQTPTSGPGGGSPGGADTNIQYNDSGSFAGSSKLTWANAIGQLVVTGLAGTAANNTPTTTQGGPLVVRIMADVTGGATPEMLSIGGATAPLDRMYLGFDSQTTRRIGVIQCQSAGAYRTLYLNPLFTTTQGYVAINLSTAQSAQCALHIGQAPPNLTVPRAIFAGCASDGPAITMARTGQSGSIELWFGIQHAAGYAEIQADSAGASFVPQNLILQRQGGNVGIGRQNPSTVLDVQGQDNLDAMMVHAGSTNRYFAWKPETDGTGSGAGEFFYWMGAGYGSLVFRHNVGIDRRPQPQYAIDANGAVNATAYFVSGQELIPGGPSPGGGGPTYMQVGGFAANATYQNNKGKTIYVSVTVSGNTAGSAAATCDANPSPSTNVAAFQSSSGGYWLATLHFIVLPNYYYGVGTTNSTVNSWITWE